MQYLVAAYETDADFARRDGENAGEYWAAWQAYTAALNEAGVMRGGNALKAPDMATTVRVRDGRHVVQDGPFSETHEVLGGYYLIECADLDEALRWAARAPCSASGSVEVRPILSM